MRTSEPFWLVKNGIIHSYPSLKEDVSTDILIVGGGITGSLIAHQLIKDGLNVILIDRRDIGSGSTSATTSMLQYEIDIPLYKLSEMIGKEAAEKAYWSCSDAIDKLEKVTQEIHSNAGFEKKKSLYFAAYKKDVAWMEEEFEARKSAGFPVKWMNAEAIENLDPDAGKSEQQVIDELTGQTNLFSEKDFEEDQKDKDWLSKQ